MSEMEKMPQEEMEIDTPGTEETVEAAAEEKADKKKKDKKDKYSEDLVIYACCKEYEIGNREAKMYISMMPQSDIEKLATKWEDCYKNEKKL